MNSPDTDAATEATESSCAAAASVASMRSEASTIMLCLFSCFYSKNHENGTAANTAIRPAACGETPTAMERRAARYWPAQPRD